MPPQPRLYLDHAATTPVLPEARAAMAEALVKWANPSSPHAEGRAARAALEDARGRVARALDWAGEVIFTSGATEALVIAWGRAKRPNRWMSPLEHDALLRLGGGGEGRDDALIAQQHVNNETGEIFGTGNENPFVLSEVEARATSDDVSSPSLDYAQDERASLEPTSLHLADCAQSAGKLPLPQADLIAISGHKLGAPPGTGALLVRDFAMLDATGGQERGYRGGTENLPAAIALATALEAPRDWFDMMPALRARLEDGIRAEGGVVVAEDRPRIPTIGSYRLPGMAATTQLIRLDLAGIAVSAGSACSSGSMKPSHVLAAMGWPEEEAREVIRVSFGRDTDAAAIDRFLDVWSKMAREARSRAA
ncbi:cysteine desulfurase family protein [Sphingomonas sp. ID0503]|uniref:cysteine desulfurase family protein n=1 Tax=Sphingomonas sp. ID0503 TaxID=3399691 RepID=UPI003AFB129B